MLGRTLIGLASLALLCLPACKADTDSGGSGIPKDDAPETFARELCAAYYDCECDDTRPNPPFTSQENCEAEIEAQLQSDFDRADDAELFYDSSCATQALEYFRNLDCRLAEEATLEDLSVLFYGINCKVLFGTDEIGESCELLNGNADDTCVQDAYCDKGTCVAYPPSPGDDCDPALSLCMDGGFCIDKSGGSDNVCEVLPGQGELCLGTLDLCGPELACNQDDKTCQPAPAEGDACAQGAVTPCSNGLHCEADMCVANPGAGEACMQTPGCAFGLTCEAGTCVTDSALTCYYAEAALL